MVQKINRTQRISQAKIISSLENIYISPLESCNLACKFCYTKKTTGNLSNEQILGFVKKYSNYIHKFYSLTLKSIILCGGEVFTLPNFSKLVNELTRKDIFVTIITNGTIDRIDEIENPTNCQILVSLDGPKKIHDQNRGTGNFEKSIKYIKHAQKLGYSVGIMFLITKDSYIYKDSFPVYLSQELNLQPSKSLNITYLTDRKMSLTSDQCLDIKIHYPTFPAKDFGCFQLSLQSNGIITGCCESNILLGKNTDNPKSYINNFVESLGTCINCQKCNGCSDSLYFCGYPKEFKLSNCQNVVQLLTKI